MPIVIGYEGPLGSGKTLDMVQRTLRDLYEVPSYWVITDMPLSDEIPHENMDFQEVLMDVAEGKQFTHARCLLLFDEVHLLDDSRNYLADQSKILSYLYIQLRKRRSKLYYTTPSMGLTALRLRQFTEPKIECFRYEADELLQFVGQIPDNWTENYGYYVEAAERFCWQQCLDPECSTPHVHKYDVMVITRNDKEIYDYSYWNLRPDMYYKYFDTGEMLRAVDYMSAERRMRVQQRLSGYGGELRPGFIIHFPEQLREDSETFQNKVYRPFVKIKNSKPRSDFEFKTNSNGLIEAVIWRGFVKDSPEGLSVQQIVQSLESSPRLDLKPDDLRWKSMFVGP